MSKKHQTEAFNIVYYIAKTALNECGGERYSHEDSVHPCFGCRAFKEDIIGEGMSGCIFHEIVYGV